MEEEGRRGEVKVGKKGGRCRGGIEVREEVEVEGRERGGGRGGRKGDR